MATSSADSSLTLAHPFDCNCTFCHSNSAQKHQQTVNPYSTVANMSPKDSQAYFDDRHHDTASDSESERQKEEKIRQAPYLPRIQVWARSDGPYTLRIGNQWFHCDDLIVNGSEYRQKPTRSSKSTATPSTPGANASQRSQRPAANRQKSYQRNRPDAQPKLAAQNQYQPQSLPVREKASRKHKDGEAQRERRDSGMSLMEPDRGALVQYTQPAPSQVSRPNQPGPRAARPGMPRRQSSRNASYQRPVRQPGRKHVRFAPSPA